MQLAFDEFKERFHNSPDQLSQDQRCSKKRSRLNAYFKQVFGLNNGIWDYWETGEMLPLSPGIPPLPRVQIDALHGCTSWSQRQYRPANPVDLRRLPDPVRDEQSGIPLTQPEVVKYLYPALC